MSNSPLVSYTRLSPNHSGRRNHSLDTITPHYMAGNGSVETCGEIFAPKSRQASSNYGIGSDGRVGMYVEECNRAWTSGSSSNDNRAVTIECANLKDGSLTDAAWKALVELCADICRRNGKTRLVYRGSANYSGLLSTDMLLTMHKWFQDTDCPGPWLSKQFDRLAAEVTAKLKGTTTTKRVSIADVAARIHHDMVTDPANGYSQGSRWGGQTGKTKTLTINDRQYTYKLGDYDCASSVITAWRLALTGTPYEGKLDGATYTGDMESAFVGSGLFTSSYTPAKRGDVYLTAKTSTRVGHTAMCQDGGSDGVYGYDCLSEFNRNENHSATGGKVGDQDGGESVMRAYYSYPWRTVLHYNGKADYDVPTTTPTTKLPVQVAGTAKNDFGLEYRAHVQDLGWLAKVHDGQTAGTTGSALRIEGMGIVPPKGVIFDVEEHIQDIGWRKHVGVQRGVSEPLIGTTYQGKRLEAIRIDIRSIPDELAGKRLRLQAHVQDDGWLDVVGENAICGTVGKAKRLEAIRMWFE